MYPRRVLPIACQRVKQLPGQRWEWLLKGAKPQFYRMWLCAETATGGVPTTCGGLPRPVAGGRFQPALNSGFLFMRCLSVPGFSPSLTAASSLRAE